MSLNVLGAISPAAAGGDGEGFHAPASSTESSAAKHSRTLPELSSRSATEVAPLLRVASLKPSFIASSRSLAYAVSSE